MDIKIMVIFALIILIEYVIQGIKVSQDDFAVKDNATRKIFDGEEVENIIQSKHDEFCYGRKPFTLNFTITGRRISEIKCLENIWKSKDAEIAANNKLWCRQLLIEGGRSASYGEFPHMGAIGWRSAIYDKSWIFKCGATLISDRFMLTAAHCSQVPRYDYTVSSPYPEVVKIGDKFTTNIYPGRIRKRLPDDFDDMILGSQTFGWLRQSRKMAPQHVPIKKFIKHKDYKSPKLYNDIAIIELAYPVSFGPLIRPACLWSSFDTSDLEKLLVTGWGIINSVTRQTTNELQVAEVSIIKDESCDDKLTLKRNRNWRGLADHQICAGIMAGGVDTCQGDSGGPLQVRMNLSQTWPMYYVVGVTSFGYGCARADLPAIYVRTSNYIEWIEKTVWSDA